MKSPIRITVSTFEDDTISTEGRLSNQSSKETCEDQQGSAKDIKSANHIDGQGNLLNHNTMYKKSKNLNKQPLSRSYSSPPANGRRPINLNKKLLEVPKVATVYQEPSKMHKTKVVSMRTKDKIGDNNHVTYYPNRKLSDSWIGSHINVAENLINAEEEKLTNKEQRKQSNEKKDGNLLNTGSSSSSSPFKRPKSGSKSSGNSPVGSFRKLKDKTKNLTSPTSEKASSGFSRGSFRKNKTSNTSTSSSSTEQKEQQTTSSSRGSFRRPKLNLKKLDLSENKFLSSITNKSGNKNKDLNNNNTNNNASTVAETIPEKQNSLTVPDDKMSPKSDKKTDNIPLLTPPVIIDDFEMRLKETEIREMIQQHFNQHLEGVGYEHEVNEKRSIHLSQQIHDNLKVMTDENFKFIVSVFIGEIRDEGMETSSQCVWDPKQDCVVMGYYKNDSLFAIAVVFAIALDSNDL
uniref:Uncharacterized protein n=1 Tax=Clytia hemisphaerica TaxID=252671 RepID=A0A7M5V1S7_9CNID